MSNNQTAQDLNKACIAACSACPTYREPDAEIARLREDLATAERALEYLAEAVEEWKERWRYERTHGCPHWGNHTSDGRDRVCWYGGPEQFDRDEKTIRAMIGWLEANQPDVFKRGIWDAINAAEA